MDLATHSRRSNGLDGSLTAGPNGIPSSQNEGRELLAVLEAALHRDLSAEQRNILVLRLIEGFSSLETATITGQSVGNVEAIQSQALAILRSIMSGKFQGNP
jgi:RNA polymerase sigma factor (sigma-70 family)